MRPGPDADEAFPRGGGRVFDDDEVRGALASYGVHIPAGEVEGACCCSPLSPQTLSLGAQAPVQTTVARRLGADAAAGGKRKRNKEADGFISVSRTYLSERA